MQPLHVKKCAPFGRGIILFKALIDLINSYFQWLRSKHTVRLKLTGSRELKLNKFNLFNGSHEHAQNRRPI